MAENNLLSKGQDMMRICNSCRYCEGFCAVWRAMEYRRDFPEGDLSYLANLCHDCSECYYACQYAPPHEWEINPPLTFARIRGRSYERHAWPKALASAYRANGLVVSLVSALALIVFLFGVVLVQGGSALKTAVPGGNFYQVTSHETLIITFGIVGLFSALAVVIGLLRFCRDIGEQVSGLLKPSVLATALKEALRLEYLDGNGWGCTYPGDESSQLRRWFHHLTFYGFLLCFAATTLGAVYHYVFGWHAPHGFMSLPVVLGALGGVGLLIGPIGLLSLKPRRNRDITDEMQSGTDTAFLLLLLLTSASGLLLLLLRETTAMGLLLVIHLGLVMALFLTFPYGKFVHGIYRFAAIAKYARERELKQTLGV
ncbi:MAG: tricarballylate utilization 4Fe-4S protein TcuB [Thermodesulfobacteriota bacterium]